MKDREQLIKAVRKATKARFSPPMRRDEADEIVDAVLALPVVVTDEMLERAWARLDETGVSEGPTLLVVDKADVRAALEAALNPPSPAQ